MNARRPDHVKGVLDGLLKKWEQTHVKKGGAVKEAWGYAVENSAKEHARPVSLKNGILMVVVEDTSWLYKLTLDKRNILARFNEKYSGRKKPKDIRFRIASLED
jgi:predicted nucleic acid-binding Zn ribbon protein